LLFHLEIILLLFLNSYKDASFAVKFGIFHRDFIETKRGKKP
jgi:hypothetical protein